MARTSVAQRPFDAAGSIDAEQAAVRRFRYVIAWAFEPFLLLV